MPLTAHGEQSALRSHRTPNTAASTAPLPASVTIMIRPSGGVGCESSRFDLVRWQQIFFGKSERKDSTALPPDGQITKFVGWVEPRETHHLHKMQLMGIAEFIIGRAFARPVGCVPSMIGSLEVKVFYPA
jgi:hypothetical protein